MAFLTPGSFGVPGLPGQIAAQKQSKTQRTIRAISGYGTSTVGVNGGALCTITDFRKDFDDTHITELNFVTVSSNLLTLTRPGYYLITYHASLFILLQESESVNPTTTVGKTILQAGGQDLAGTQGFVTMTEIPNLNKFLKGPAEGALEIGVNLNGATGKTAAFETMSFAKCDGDGCEFGITDATLDGEGKQDVTLNDQTLDATTNIETVTTESTDSYVRGSTSGTAVVTVKYNASNVLKVFIDGTEYDPTIGVKGSRETGTADVLNLSTSISLIKLF